MAKFKRRHDESGDTDGNWFKMPLRFLQSRACAELSPHALKLLVDICSQMGPGARGNGDLSAVGDFLQARGWASNATRLAALKELQDADLLVVTRHGDRRRCHLYAVTLWPMNCDWSKLDVKQGSFSVKDWRGDNESRMVPPSTEQPARWRSARPRTARAISGPAAGPKTADIVPLRGNRKRA